MRSEPPSYLELTPAAECPCTVSVDPMIHWALEPEDAAQPLRCDALHQKLVQAHRLAISTSSGTRSRSSIIGGTIRSARHSARLSHCVHLGLHLGDVSIHLRLAQPRARAGAGRHRRRSTTSTRHVELVQPSTLRLRRKTKVQVERREVCAAAGGDSALDRNRLKAALLGGFDQLSDERLLCDLVLPRVLIPHARVDLEVAALGKLPVVSNCIARLAAQRTQQLHADQLVV
mmetsp:Transcript_22684/g.59185  ORF Transcript_22684/g.59185 Transcript_22684/m.59185 type:complete len:231 (+) Transcript_22684:1601-2293(+)